MRCKVIYYYGDFQIFACVFCIDFNFEGKKCLYSLEAEEKKAKLEETILTMQSPPINKLCRLILLKIDFAHSACKYLQVLFDL